MRDRVYYTGQEYADNVAVGISRKTIDAWASMLSAEAKAASGIVESPTGKERIARWYPSDLDPAKLAQAARESVAQAAK